MNNTPFTLYHIYSRSSRQHAGHTNILIDRLISYNSSNKHPQLAQGQLSIPNSTSIDALLPLT